MPVQINRPAKTRSRIESSVARTAYQRPVRVLRPKWIANAMKEVQTLAPKKRTTSNSAGEVRDPRETASA
jgi:hypothetical protein